MALIRIDDDVCICVGSLIHPKAVLTGNHCVKEYVYLCICVFTMILLYHYILIFVLIPCSYATKAKDLKIRAGEWDTQTTKERLPYQERIVSRIFGHPNFNERNLANDIVS